MSTEENKGLPRRLMEGVSAGDLSIIDEVYSPDLVYHGSGELAHASRDQPRSFFSTVLAAFPDSKLLIEGTIAEGDKVVTHWSQSGRHQGEFFGVPPTGREVSVQGISIARVAGGKIVEEWEQVDILGLMQQVGVAPEPAAAG